MASAGFDVEATPARLPALESEVRFAVEMDGGHSTADVASVVQAIDDLTVGAVWGMLAGDFTEAEHEADLELISALRLATSDAYGRSPVAESDQLGSQLVLTALNAEAFETPVWDNWTLAAVSGTNQWLKRGLFDEESALYDEVFSFAQVEHAQHSSPLVVLIGLAPVGGAAWLAHKGVRWVYKVRKERAEAKAAEAHARIADSQARIEGVKADLVEQAAHDLQNDPELLAKVQERVLDRLLPGAETLIEHPKVKRVELLDEAA